MNKKVKLFGSIILMASLISCTDSSKESQNSSNSNIVPPAALNMTSGYSNEINQLLSAATNYYANGDFSNAVASFSKVLEKDSLQLPALIGMGNLHYDTNNDSIAIHYYEKAISIDPNNLNVRCDQATCFYRLGKFDKAIELNQKIVEMNHNFTMAHYNLSVIFNAVGKPDEAKKELDIYNQLSIQQNLQ